MNRALISILVLFLGQLFSSNMSFAEQFNCSDCHTGTQIASKPHTDVGCGDCHSNISKIPHQNNVLAQLGGKQICAQCHDDVVTGFNSSLHAKNGCASCHGSIHKGWKDPKTACTSCHEKPTHEFNTSTHAKKDVACTDCHGDSHKIIDTSDPQSQVSPANQPNACGKCHSKDIIKGYLQSDHGRGVVSSGLTVAPTCTTCHGTHAIYAANNPHSKVSDRNLPGMCGSCHKGVFDTWKESVHGQLWVKGDPGPVCTTCHSNHEILNPMIAANRIRTPERCEGCHEAKYETYRDSFHGKATELGFLAAAACSDCHTPHYNFPKTDIRSTVHKDNLQKTCGSCHGEVSAKFVQFDPHIDPHSEEAHPVVHYVWLFMTMLLVGTFAFFVIHTLLWLQRVVVAFMRKEIKPIHRHGDVWVRRFKPVHQWLHVTIVVTFLILASTGLPLKFHNVPWANAVANVLGGVAVARFFHRVAGILTFGYSAFFLGYLIREIVIKRRGELLWGWKSMVPNKKDLIDVYHNVRWFFYMGPPPKLDRWAYWEKFDFFAVFWGVPVIGFSGLMLWFPNVVSSLLPGWVLNLAYVVHGDEALLATGFIFFFHFFHSHLRPENFPLDPVIFTGSIPLERLKEERPEEYEKLQKSGELKDYIVPAPSEVRMRVAHIFGFIALGIGSTLGILLLIAGFKVVF